jgi:multiple sugar transport system permease protein
MEERRKAMETIAAGSGARVRARWLVPLVIIVLLIVAAAGLAYWNSLASQPGVAQVLYILVITGSAVAIVPVILVFLFLQRYWQGGLGLGSVKG